MVASTFTVNMIPTFCLSSFSQTCLRKAKYNKELSSALFCFANGLLPFEFEHSANVIKTKVYVFTLRLKEATS